MLRNVLLACLALCPTAILAAQTNLFGHNQKPPGAYRLVPEAAVAAYICEGQFGRGSTCGNVSFEQQDFPHQPVVVTVCLELLKEGDYALDVLFWGDTSDECKEKAGKRYHRVLTFTVNSTHNGFYGYIFKNYDISVRDHLGGIVGRTLAVLRKGNSGDYDEVVGCEPIGLADETVHFKYLPSRLHVHDPVPPHLRHGYPNRIEYSQHHG